MSKLFVNIDHVATLREARKGIEPSPLHALYECHMAGISGVTIHLREDERHIKLQDVYDIKKHKKIVMNLESSLEARIVEVVCDVKPEITCIVPEKREEVTTEGGLDVSANKAILKNIIKRYHENGIEVSLFIDADKKSVDVSKELGADSIEIHTGKYANSNYFEQPKEAKIICDMVNYSYSLGLKVNLGHGLNYDNIKPFLNNEKISEFNIGHSIISQSIFVGLRQAIIDMRLLIEG